MIKVLIEQQVIPPYRVPFFAKLANYVNLLVLASDGVNIPGVGNMLEVLPFQFLQSHETFYRNQYPYHKNVIDALRQHQAEIYISNGNYLVTCEANSKLRNEIRTIGVRMIWWGCDGYWIRNFDEARRQNLLRYRLIHPRTWHSLLRFYAESRAMKMVHGFIAYSNHTAAYWQQVHKIPSSKITVASNSIDVEPLLRHRELLIGGGLKRTKGSIIFVGRMTSGKNINLLLRSFRIVKGSYPEATLWLVGDGPLRAQLEQNVCELALNDVTFLGELQDQERLADVMCRASLFVLPGLGGLGINAAMACGLPVICSQGDGTELDLVREGLNGWSFISGSEEDLARVIIIALSDPDQLEWAGKESLKLIENVYNLDNMVNAFVETIHRVAGHP